jgi:erythromycin esterase-like protein
MSRSASALVEALGRAADAMDAETAALRSGRAAEWAQAAERKGRVIEAAEAVLREGRSIGGAATPAERPRLEEAARRMQAAASRNAATLQGSLEGTRRLFACLAEAAQRASSTGTYGPDGSLRRSAESVGTICRRA